MAEGHLLFVWNTSGYELVEEPGDPPAVGSALERDGRALRVTKIGPSPLPGDKRPCAYVAG